MTNKCTTIINEKTGETCGIEKRLHYPKIETWNIERPCKKFTPEDDTIDKTTKCNKCGYSENLHPIFTAGRKVQEKGEIFLEWVCEKFTIKDEHKFYANGGCSHGLEHNKGCGEWYLHANEDRLNEPRRCGKHGICPECQSKSEIEPKGNIKPPDTQNPHEIPSGGIHSGDTFCLKDKRKMILTNEGNQEGFYPEESVKEFIKGLREKLCKCDKSTEIYVTCESCWEINKRIRDLE